MDFELTTEQRLALLELHRREWARAEYNASLNAKVAKKLDDKRMLDAAAEEMKRVLVALEVLQEEELALQAEQEEGKDGSTDQE